MHFALFRLSLKRIFFLLFKQFVILFLLNFPQIPKSASAHGLYESSSMRQGTSEKGNLPEHRFMGRLPFTFTGVNFINMLTSYFYMHRLHKRKKTVKSSGEKRLRDFCCCTSADLCFLPFAQV